MRVLLFLAVASILVASANRETRAGAFMAPEGAGQFIAGVGYAAGSRRFDSDGTAVPGANSRKVVASGYLEYGLTSWLTLVAAPTLARRNDAAANAITGSDSSALGARLLLFGTRQDVVAVQALLQPPTGNSDQASMIADGGASTFAADLRLLYGRSFALLGLPAFVDIEPGVRLRPDPLPGEVRLDLVFGLRPIPRLMLLVQSFSAWAPERGPLIPRQSTTKVQASLVYDLSARWSVQVGAFRTIAGRNALRETGPMAALWYRF